MQISTLTPPLKYRPRPVGVVVDTIVLHATAGANLDGAIQALRASGNSYHYIVEDGRDGHDGRVTKCVPSTARANHAGNSYGPHEASRELSRTQDFRGNFVAGCSVNDYTIGISLVNVDDGHDPYSQAQYDSVIELIRELKAAFPALRYLTTHYAVSPRRKVDPVGFDVHRVAAAVGLELWGIK